MCVYALQYYANALLKSSIKPIFYVRLLYFSCFFAALELHLLAL
jgi:hypothetical protein